MGVYVWWTRTFNRTLLQRHFKIQHQDEALGDCVPCIWKTPATPCSYGRQSWTTQFFDIRRCITKSRVRARRCRIVQDSVVDCNNNIYKFCKHVNNTHVCRVLADVWVFNMLTSEWKRLVPGGLSPSAREMAAGVMISSHDFVVMGGRGHGGVLLDDAHLLNLDSDPSWKPVLKHDSLRRCAHTAVAMNISKTQVNSEEHGFCYGMDKPASSTKMVFAGRGISRQDHCFVWRLCRQGSE